MGVSSKTLPDLSTTLRMGFNEMRWPVLARTPYAVARSNMVTSPPPKVIDGPYLVGSVKVVRPKAEEEATKFSKPLRTKVLTAGMLKELARANLT